MTSLIVFQATTIYKNLTKICESLFVGVGNCAVHDPPGTRHTELVYAKVNKPDISSNISFVNEKLRQSGFFDSITEKVVEVYSYNHDIFHPHRELGYAINAVFLAGSIGAVFFIFWLNK